MAGRERALPSLWVLPSSITYVAACDAPVRSVERVGSYLASGQLELLSHSNWYLDTAGRLKSFEEIAGALPGRQDQVLAKRFKFLRGWEIPAGFRERPEQGLRRS